MCGGTFSCLCLESATSRSETETIPKPMTTESDRLLITRVRKNDQSAWAELDKRYRGRLTAYVRRRLKDHASVEDVVQETFIGFSNSLANYDDKRDLQTWLFTIAAHKVTDQLRKMGRLRYQTGTDSDEEVMVQSADERQRVASSLARSVSRRSISAAISACLLSTASRVMLLSGLSSQGARWPWMAPRYDSRVRGPRSLRAAR